jgi:hypothetical protein
MNYIKKKEIIKNLVSEIFNEKYKENKEICFIDSTFDTNYEAINKKLLSPDELNVNNEAIKSYLVPRKSKIAENTIL